MKRILYQLLLLAGLYPSLALGHNFCSALFKSKLTQDQLVLESMRFMKVSLWKVKSLIDLKYSDKVGQKDWVRLSQEYKEALVALDELIQHTQSYYQPGSSFEPVSPYIKSEFKNKEDYLEKYYQSFKAQVTYLQKMKDKILELENSSNKPKSTLEELDQISMQFSEFVNRSHRRF